MGFMDEYNKALQEAAVKSASASGSSSKYMEEYYKAGGSSNSAGSHSLPFRSAPISDRYSSRMTVSHKKKKKEEEEEKKRKWYESELFDDGYDFGDVSKAILGVSDDTASLKDLTVNSFERGYYNSIYGEESFKAMNGGQNKKDEYAQILAGDEYQFTPGNDAAGAISGAMELFGQLFRQHTNPRTLTFVGTAAGAAAIAGNAGPQVLVPEEIVTVPAAATAAFVAGSTASNLEIEAGHAYNEMLEKGISEETAKKIAWGVGGVNASLEFVQTDQLIKAFKATKASGTTKRFAKKIADELVARGIVVANETAQEVAQEAVTMTGVQAASQLEKGESAYSWDDVTDRLKYIAKSSALSFGLMNAPATVTNTASIVNEQHKANSLTKNEQAVVDKVTADRVSEAEKDGTKLSNSDKKKIKEVVVSDMENGFIPIDTIEEVLGGEKYEQYKQASEWESSLQTEFDKLNKMKQGEMTGEQVDRREALRTQLKNVKATSTLAQQKAQIRDEVMGMVKSDRLVESYREYGNSRKAFEADVNQYSEKQRVIVQKAIDAKTAEGNPLLSNSRHTHTFVDFVAKISEDTDVDFEFTDTKRLQEAGFALEGQTIDGFYNPKESKVTLNLNSPKARQFVVGHEITHALEGTDLYDALRKSVFDYAKMKNQYGVRMESIQKRYKEGTDFEAELTADLVGEYIFSDTDFINNLSTQNRNVFQKVYDEIKYLCKVATAGSKEARELERVKRAFEKAYREGGKAQTDAETKLSVSENAMSDSDGKQLTKEQQDYFKDSKMRDDNGNLKVMYHGSQDAGFHVFDSKFSDDDTSFFFVDRNDVAASYSGTSETYEAKTIRTAEDMNNFLAEIGYDQYEAVEKDGKFELLEDGDHVATSDTAQGIYEEFCWYEGVGEGDANYKVYLNLKNPLVVEAHNSEWNDLPPLDDHDSLYEYIKIADYSYNVFTEEENVTIEYLERGSIDSVTEEFDPENFPVDVVDAIYEAIQSGETVIENVGSNYRWKTRDYAKYAKENGYDGVIFNDIYDVGAYDNGSEGASTVAIAFDSNQIKSVANDKPTADPDIRYSLSEVTEEQNQKGLDTKSELSYSISNDTKYADSAILLNKKTGYVSDEVMYAQKVMRERVAERLREMVEKGVALPKDKEGDTFFSNSSYGGSEENTTICPRSLAPEAFMDAVSEYIGRPLTVNEQIYVCQDLMNRMGSSEELRGQNFLAQCVYCYVAADRMSQREFLGEYINQRDAMLQKVTPEMDISQLHKDHRALAAWWKDKKQAKPELSEIGKLYQEFLNGRKPTGATYKRVKMWLDASRNGKPMIDGNHLANIDKLVGDISQFGDELKPQIQDAWKYAQSASWAKKRVGYVAYNGHIQKWTQKKVDDLNKHYGLRMYSFSDFHPVFVLENMQMVSDAAVRGLKMLGYTKDIDFVEIFAPSGMNINVSTFGFEKGGSVYEDNRMGAEWKKAQELRAKYPNVGITFVATNDTMVKWAMKQDWIDVVIPYHIVKTGEVIAKHYGYQNYTTESSDTKTKEWKKGNEKYIAPPVHNNDLDTYLSALKHNGLEARFKRFLEDPETRPYYMKLVNECRQSSSESKAVQPIFDEEAIDRTLAKLESEGYYTPIGGSVERMYEIAGEVAESMSSQIAPAMSLSNVGEQHTPDSLSALRLTAEESSVVAPTVSETESVREMFPDDGVAEQEELENLQAEEAELRGVMEAYAGVGDIEAVNKLIPEHESIQTRIRELQQHETDRADSLTDSDAPPEMDAPLNIESENYNPYSGVTLDEITRSTRTYSDRNPGARQYIEEGALGFLYDVNNSTHGERWYNDELYYATGGEQGFGGTARSTTADIEYLKDSFGYTWEQLRKAAEDVVKGEVRSAAAKRVEFLIHNRLMEGYTDVDGRRYEPNQNYITFLNNSFAESVANENSEGSFNSLLENADQYAPTLEEQYAPKLNSNDPRYEEDVAPIFEDKGGQTTMFEPEKPNTSGKVGKVLTQPSKPDVQSNIGMKALNLTVDKGQAVENLSLKTGNDELQAKYNYALGRYTEARAQYFMENGADGLKSYKKIVDEIIKSGKRNAFEDYLGHALNMDRMSLEARYGTPNKAVFGDSVTAEMSQKTVAEYEANNPEFKQWAEEIYEIMRYCRQMLVDGNLASQETADLWEQQYPHYVPIERSDKKGRGINVPLDTNKTGVNAPIHRATGGNTNIEPFLNTIAKRIEQTYRAVARNDFGIELKNTLGTTINAQQNNSSVDSLIDLIDDQDSQLLKPGSLFNNPTFTVFENGERVEFEITEELFDSLKPAGALGYRNKVISKIGDIRRNLLTNWNTKFSLWRNPQKDAKEVFLNSQHPTKTYMNMFVPTKDNAWIQILANGEYAQEYHKNGGKSVTYYDRGKNDFVKEDGTAKKIVKNTVGVPFRSVMRLGEIIEEVPRLAEYTASRKEGRSVEQSMLDAARVTTNFAAGGDVTKFANAHGCTFLNASVQGAAQHVRNFREGYNKEGIVGATKVLGKYILTGVPALVFNHLMWDDDEDYEELNDYVKENYWVVWKTGDGKFIRLPKGRTEAVMNEAIQQTMNLVTGNDEFDLSTLNELFWNNIAPNNPRENNIFAPIRQAFNNEAWYGDEIVPSRLQDLPTEEQYDESTDALSKWLGENFDPFELGPYRINYLLDQYSGGIGDTLLPMMTPEAESGDNSLVGNLIAPWKKEVTTDSVLNNKNPGNFYELKDELEVVSNGKNATEEDKMRSMYLDSVSWEMGDLYAQKREIQNSDLPDDQKYEKVREIQEHINEIANNALNQYNSVSIDGKYATVGDRRFDYSDYSSKWYEIEGEYLEREQNAVKRYGITPSEYWNDTDLYYHADWYFDVKYATVDREVVANLVFGGKRFAPYAAELGQIKGEDKNGDGKTDSGTKKTNVFSYIDGLNVTDTEKMIMRKMSYPSEDKYNDEIVDYLNGRDDIDYNEMKSILEALGAKVDDRGYITW